MAETGLGLLSPNQRPLQCCTAKPLCLWRVRDGVSAKLWRQLHVVLLEVIGILVSPYDPITHGGNFRDMGVFASDLILETPSGGNLIEAGIEKKRMIVAFSGSGLWNTPYPCSPPYVGLINTGDSSRLEIILGVSGNDCPTRPSLPALCFSSSSYRCAQTRQAGWC